MRSKFNVLIYQACTSLMWQLIFTSVLIFIFFQFLCHGTSLYSTIIEIKKPDFVSYISGMAAIAALFCSVSFGFVLHFIQFTNSERYSTFGEFKSKLREFDNFASSLPESKDKEIFKSLIWELDKFDISDLPQTDYGESYKDYATTLDKVLSDGSDIELRKLYLNSALHTGYIEQLLSRIGINAIRIIRSRNFADTLTKGISLVIVMILLLFSANVYFDQQVVFGYISAALWLSFMLSFVFVEFLMDLYWQMDEALDFVERDEA